MKTHASIFLLLAVLTVSGCKPKADPEAPVGPAAWTAFRSDTGKWGFQDANGKTVIEAKFDSLLPFSEDRARVRLDGKFGFIDTTGKLAVPAEYDDARSFSHGRSAVKLEEKFGYIDADGKVAIEIKFDYADGFAKGYATVSLNGQTGYVDPQGVFKKGEHPEYSEAENEMEEPAKEDE